MRIVDNRVAAGVGLVYPKGAIAHAQEALERGESMYMLLDQSLPAKAAVFVPFFGRPASTTPAMAVVAQRTGAPVFVMMGVRDASGRKLRLELEGPIRRARGARGTGGRGGAHGGGGGGARAGHPAPSRAVAVAAPALEGATPGASRGGGPELKSAMTRTLFIGDVHGCPTELDALLRKCRYRPGERVVLVGDLVAKGPDSAGVVRRAREGGWLAVRGNHDEHVLRWRAGLMPEGKKLKREHKQVLETLEEADWDYLESLPLHLYFPDLHVRVVHGGFVPDVPLEEQPAEMMLNLRSIKPDGGPSKKMEAGEPWASLWKGPELVIFGHDALRGRQEHPHAIGLDSGCVYGGRLTAYALPDARFYSVKAKKVYMGLDD